MAVKIKKLRSGKYGLAIDHKGKRKQISVGTRAAAEKAKTKIEISIAMDKLGILEKKQAPTFQEVSVKFIELVQLSKSPSTYTRYKGILDKYLVKHLGRSQIDKITRGDIRDTLLTIYRGGSSRASVELIHTVASGVFMYALDDELIQTVPTMGILRRLDLKQDSKQIQPFTADQFGQVLFGVGKQFYPFFATAYYTAARVGEICALQWGDINFNEMKIRISKTAKDQHVKMSTKTYMVREIDLSLELLPILEDLKRKDREICFQLGIEQDHVFHDRGRLLAQNTLRRKLSAACKKLGIGHKTIHDIRHTTASILLARGTPLIYVSKFLGHSSPTVTLNSYSHFMPSENEGLISNLGDKKAASMAGVK